ncbi:MAG: class I SAM-dependent methyltransferase [Thermoplasmata archaeon]|nr:class I SAM-dependent methyltransferase [Thermoplasmata archaeon]
MSTRAPGNAPRVEPPEETVGLLPDNYPRSALALTALRHPLSIPRFLSSRLAYRSNLRHSRGIAGVRLEPPDEFFRSLTGGKELSSFPVQTPVLEGLVMTFRRIGEEYSRRWNSPLAQGSSALDLNDARVLYALVRARTPRTVIETGVSDGFSSLVILEALEENGGGTLHSIDLPEIGAPSLIGRAPGWVVPERLRPRWRLHLGPSRRVLPKLLREIPRPEMFLHDSEHSYTNMRFEFSSVLPRLGASGLLLSDDARSNDALIEAAQEHGGRASFCEGRLGGIARGSAAVG